VKGRRRNNRCVRIQAAFKTIPSTANCPYIEIGASTIDRQSRDRSATRVLKCDSENGTFD